MRCHNLASDLTSNISLIVNFFIVPASYKHRFMLALLGISWPKKTNKKTGVKTSLGGHNVGSVVLES